MTQKILKSLSITLMPHVLRSRDPRTILTSLFSAWLPLSTALLVSVIEYLPSPPVAQAARFPLIIQSSPGADYIDDAIKAAVTKFKSGNDDPVVAYVSKMVAIPESQLPGKKARNGALSAEEARELGRKKRAEIARAQALAGENEASQVDGLSILLGSSSIDHDDESRRQEASSEEPEDPEHLIGFARLYSGTLSVGDEVYVLPPKFTPASPQADPAPSRATITALYMMMGRALEPLTSVPAGVVFGVAGLEGHIYKSGTLCSQHTGAVNLAGLTMGIPPIVRVALEPVNPGDLDKMINGLRLLVQSDPAAEYEVLESGEHVIVTAGELHLERCLKDLRERFAKCEIQAGEPIVPYRESIVSAAEMAPPRNKDLPRGTVIGSTASKQLTVRLRVRPLPAPVTEFLIKNAGSVRRLVSERRAEEEAAKRNVGEEMKRLVEEETAVDDGLSDRRVVSVKEFKSELQQAFQEVKGERETWANVVDKIAAFGPRRVGPNIFIDGTKSESCTGL